MFLQNLASAVSFLVMLTIISCGFANIATASNTSTPAGKASMDPLMDLSIEELIQIKITSVSRREQKLSGTPSAIFVITQEDIRRSGATSIPEALRMAPGVEVARVGTDKWSISVRGFNGRFANKLQVLMESCRRKITLSPIWITNLFLVFTSIYIKLFYKIILSHLQIPANNQ